MTPAQKVNIKQLTYGENQDLIENQKSTVFDYNEKGFLISFELSIYISLIQQIKKYKIFILKFDFITIFTELIILI